MTDLERSTQGNPAPRQSSVPDSTAMRIAADLPYLRRYARALTGSQETGDRYAAATLEAMVNDRSLLARDDDLKIALFAAFHAVWQSSGAPIAQDGISDDPGIGLEARAQAHLARLTPNTREALLLRTIEEFAHDEIGRIMQIDASEAQDLIAIAYREMEASIRGKVMVIEDEPLIALDIRNIVNDMGHDVTGIARTRDQAIKLGLEKRPDLILADIQLADNSSGIDAVRHLMGELGDVPVIFITAFPDRLLTGERPEPAFLITKPFSPEQVRSAVSQAMFFASTETLMS
ncbi:MAG: response regulator [Pararhodobacter sp.]|nr:response regulator [Pararhodobacter sp.]